MESGAALSSSRKPDRLTPNRVWVSGVFCSRRGHFSDANCKAAGRSSLREFAAWLNVNISGAGEFVTASVADLHIRPVSVPATTVPVEWSG